MSPLCTVKCDRQRTMTSNWLTVQPVSSALQIALALPADINDDSGISCWQRLNIEEMRHNEVGISTLGDGTYPPPGLCDSGIMIAFNEKFVGGQRAEAVIPSHLRYAHNEKNFDNGALNTVRELRAEKHHGGCGLLFGMKLILSFVHVLNMWSFLGSF